MPGYEATIWLGVMAPKGTPKDVVDYLNTAHQQGDRRPEVKAAWLKQGAVPMSMTPDEFDAYPEQGHREVGEGGQDRPHFGAVGMLRRLLIPVAALVLAALAVIAVLQEMVANDQAAERRALLARNAELARAALAPGSVLACLDGGAGEKVGDACEQDVFASPQAVAAAVALESARLALLQAAFTLSKHGDAQVMPALADLRRAAELDRYGIAAHVLATRDGCTALKC